MWTLDSSDSLEWAQGESFTRQPGRITPAAGAPSYADKVARIQSTILGSPLIQAGAGAVILMHDTHNATRDALPAVIDGLRAAGYTFATVEDYVRWRWGRPSADVTPGPALWNPCVDERDWGCASAGNPVREICGRLWRAYQWLGGADALGAPIAPARRDPVSALPTGVFAGATVTLHPETAAPCDVVATPTQ